jgi:hypothetical protein
MKRSLSLTPFCFTDGMVYVWERKSGTLVHRINTTEQDSNAQHTGEKRREAHPDEGNISAIACQHLGKGLILAVGFLDGTLRIYTTRSISPSTTGAT